VDNPDKLRHFVEPAQLNAAMLFGVPVTPGAPGP